MSAPSYSRSLTSAVKRLKLSPSTSTFTTQQVRQLQHSAPLAAQPLSPNLERELSEIRLPKAVQATYLAPLKREPTTPRKANEPIETVCQLQLRSYNVRNLEVFSDFALRAAYFLQLPATSYNLPRRTERWTVPRSNFVHKKSQENFERITMRREIVIKEGNPETVSVWLAFLRKYQYYGVGLKANVFEYGSLKAAEEMDAEAKRVEELLGSIELEKPAKGMGQLGLPEKMVDQAFKASWGAYAPSSGAQSVPDGNKRIATVSVEGGLMPEKQEKKTKGAEKEEAA
ncbi:37S ribosomal protein S10, mitochondrial [Cercospora beticola]|uniref:Small ribosomal subunit protein uS10m n=1 Tax=Cercospora beticola TaxID=122368 RepID=A0A2G5HH23_CERBT|nr:37S ribosomal protein S10, mitochondrial [Cercospora beticola]PIA91840.1 37S ribosomal protein S10, mitochondrial [Cercospora beticola]WPB06555.1 hypothetical protein RHO25_011212 [Cercospora beticola]CAK1366466.1 unnamed protein product [Cercospora beticola]